MRRTVYSKHISIDKRIHSMFDIDSFLYEREHQTQQYQYNFKHILVVENMCVIICVRRGGHLCWEGMCFDIAQYVIESQNTNSEIYRCPMFIAFICIDKCMWGRCAYYVYVCTVCVYFLYGSSCVFYVFLYFCHFSYYFDYQFCPITLATLPSFPTSFTVRPMIYCLS